MSRRKFQPWTQGLVRGLEKIQIFRKKGVFVDLRKVNQRKLEVEVTMRAGVPCWVTGRKGPEMHVDLHMQGRNIGVRKMNHWKLLPDLDSGFNKVLLPSADPPKWLSCIKSNRCGVLF